MFWPFQIASNFLSLNFAYRLDFHCDEKKILDEYNQWIKNNQLTKHPDNYNTNGISYAKNYCAPPHSVR